MIKDNLANINKYKNLDENLVKGLELLKNIDFSKIEEGKHIIDDNMYFNLQTYTTKDDSKFEAHRDYIDIQYIVSGEEKIGVTDYKICTSYIPYDKEKDIEFLDGEGEYYNISHGEFMILEPNDAHKPSIKIDEPTVVTKVVVKVRV